MNNNSSNTNNTLQFSSFGKQSKTSSKANITKNVVVYTRVSTKEQADTNFSLETQRKVIEEYAQRNELNILQFFGGTYESAKTDGRKEFLRMLNFIKTNREKTSQILVYTLDRFSRTGGSAIKIASDLREKHGISVFAVTQPTDTTNPSGVLHQNIQLLFSEFDNQQRRQRVIAGMKEKFKMGYWVVKPPQGYDIIKINGDRRIVVNEEGKKIKKAFEWKATGMKNEEIISKLNAMGVKMYKQQLHKIFVNPFYCGMIAHGMLEGKVIEGKHEAMISRKLFLKANNMVTSSSKYGVPHKLENINLPLKTFVICSECNKPLTGYIMKKRNIYYYKCRTKGCCLNRNAEQLHLQFKDLLSQYSVDPECFDSMLYEMVHVFGELNKESVEKEKIFRVRQAEILKKLETIEEKFYALNQMDEETFVKFKSKYIQEKKIVDAELELCGLSGSNMEGDLKQLLELSLKLKTVWTSGDVSIKEKLQKLVFPEGIEYNRQTSGVRAKKVNGVFGLIADLSKLLEDNKKGTSPFMDWKSLSAEKEGFEPPEVLPSTVFKTAAIDRSATSPRQRYIFFNFTKAKYFS